MTTSMAFGSFDILHEGHINYLKQAKKFGNLIVIVAKDSNIMRFKGKKPRNDENKRLKKLKELDFVDEAVLGKENIFDVLDKFRPDFICLGYDQNTASEEKIKEELEKRNLKAKIVRLYPYKEDIYKSSKLKNG